MKKIISLLLSAILISSCIPVFAAETVDGRCLIYVATDGNDAADGSIETPLATLTAARDKIRELKKTGQYPKGFTVYVRGGNYNVSEGLVLENEDSGTATAPITYRAYGDEKVTFTGGVSVSGKNFEKVSDPAILGRIVEKEARNEVYMLDLSKYGVTQIDDPFWPGGYSYGNSFIKAGVITGKPSAASIEVLFNGKAMTIARYPNEGNMKVSEVTVPGWDFNEPDIGHPGDPMSFTVTDDRISYWTEAAENSILLYGFWKLDYADQTIPLSKIDAEKKELTTKHSSCFSTKMGREFYAFNLLEEIDVPGEYYIDQQSKILYLYPSAPIVSADITITLSDQTLFTLKNTEYINIRGLNVVGSRTHAYTISGGKYNEISDCEISYTAQRAVRIVDGYRNGIRNCYVHDVEGGIELNSNNEAFYTLIATENYAENNHVERFSRLSATYVSGIGVGGVGNIARNNKIHDGPHLAIDFSGCLNKIMYNEIYDVVKASDDAGAIYGGLNWTMRGVEIKYNYIHDIVKDTTLTGTAGLGGIYLDGGQCETIMVGNVFENIQGQGIWINGGQDNVAINNVFIDCTQGVLINDIMTVIDFEENTTWYDRLEAATYVNSEAYKERFPKTAKMLELSDEEKKKPYGNICLNNLAFRGTVVNKQLPRLRTATQEYADITQNLEATTDPGFVDLANKDYTIKKDSDVFEQLPGFETVAFKRMGLLSKRAETRVQDSKILVIDSPYSFVNGEKVMIDEENAAVVAFVKDGVTYVPLRFIAEVLDADVEWNEETDEVTVTGAQMSLTIPANGTEAKKSGEDYTLSNPTMVMNDRTLVPLREISELFEKSVFWHPSGFICVSDDEALFDEKGSDDELIRHLYALLNIY